MQTSERDNAALLTLVFVAKQCSDLVMRKWRYLLQPLMTYRLEHGCQSSLICVYRIPDLLLTGSGKGIGLERAQSRLFPASACESRHLAQRRKPIRKHNTRTCTVTSDGTIPKIFTFSIFAALFFFFSITSLLS